MNDSDCKATESQRVQGLPEYEAVSQFIESIKKGDIGRFMDAAENLKLTGAWTNALHAVADLDTVPADFKLAVQEVWVEQGDSMRGDARADAALVKALRVLLPAYDGPNLTLYRGESAKNHRTRSYGLSWTVDVEVAEDYARDAHRYSQDDGVVLMTEAQAEAIISAPHRLGVNPSEAEYLVDGQLLKQVRVIKTFPRNTDQG
jgi:hypothetical protein